jgi:hypothetical protein
VQVKQHHIPLPVKSDIKRFEDSLPVHERALDVALIVTVRASLQIRVFGGEQWQQHFIELVYLSDYFSLVQ